MAPGNTRWPRHLTCYQTGELRSPHLDPDRSGAERDPFKEIGEQQPLALGRTLLQLISGRRCAMEDPAQAVRRGVLELQRLDHAKLVSQEVDRRSASPLLPAPVPEHAIRRGSRLARCISRLEM